MSNAPPGTRRRRNRPRALSFWLHACVLALAETLVAFMFVSAGMALHILLLCMLVLSAALTADPKRSALYQALVLAPIVRVLSLSLPLGRFEIVYWYLLTGIPLLASSAAVVLLAGFRREDVGLRLGTPKKQLLVTLTGIPLGLIEYCILRPAPLAEELTLRAIWLPALLLMVFTGFTEEFVFRGAMQRAAAPLGKAFELYFVSFVFAALHITHRSALDVAFVFGVAMLFGHAVRKDGSIIGVSVAHGLTNVGLYLVWPLLLG